MDGVAAAGTSALYSRGDHRHPSDTTRVAKGGDTMTGQLVLPTGPGPTHAVRKDYVDAADAAVATNIASKVSKTGDTMSGSLTISVSVSPALTLNKTSGYNIIQGHTNGMQRWFVAIGDSAVETGSNVGSDFSIYRYSDASGYLGVPLSISRATGILTTGPIYTPGGLWTVSNNNPGIGNTAVGVEIGQDYFIVSRAGATAYFNVNTYSSNLIFQLSGTIVGSISHTVPGSTQYNTSSDVRLKEDLKTFDASHIIDTTNVYDFAWKSTKNRAYGVIAQEAVNVYPAAISHDETHDWWGVDYSKYMPIVLQELKALRARVAELEVLAGARPAPPDPKTHG
jgi:hypothetical protein